MKKLLAIVLIVVITFFSSQSAWADAEGAKVFSSNCAACHMGGGNVINSQKTLKKDVLEKYEMASIEAITTQVTRGKNAMPAFKGRLSDVQIAEVAAYVLEQSEKDWK
ncbi:MAG: c-type cytochrome [Drouetiella hepatica Uher 2000/2452]|uniref:Cytochrome c6 n=1 Tax=Drouetiella hepatica Uher 2000/2452 TaxID=904376 RepID=A0A951UNI7_9CYAN|nr:c-type cytochrome [Drouetiella hepatica Uher 2000/2452]